MRKNSLLSWLACASVTLAQAPAPAISVSVTGTATDSRIKDVIVGGFQPASQVGGQPIPVKAFTPETVVANPGDTIRFTFLGTNHSVMQSTVDSPCVQMSGGFTSGSQPNPNNDLATAPQVNFSVPATPGPLYMSTLNTANCGVGMVLTVNPPAEGQPGSHTQFKQNAITQGNRNLQIGGIVVAQAPAQAQAASTVTIQAAGSGTPSMAAGKAGTIVQGTGRTGSGAVCGCQCLCGGAGVGVPASVAMGNFGGVAGIMPMAQVAMSPTSMGAMRKRRGYAQPLM